ncbi:MAG TPA: response regulator [Anaerolineae bacterium]|nr:response regulator [Anaerolineae bacterium]
MALVYVVDDDPVICRLAQHILNQAGYTVELLHDGVEALEAMQRSTPDVLVTDLMMPNMSGLALIRHIRADSRWSSLPIVVFTARGERSDRRQAEEAGVSHYLTKPFSSAQLLEAVRRFAQPNANPPS